MGSDGLRSRAGATEFLIEAEEHFNRAAHPRHTHTAHQLYAHHLGCSTQRLDLGQIVKWLHKLRQTTPDLRQLRDLSSAVLSGLRVGVVLFDSRVRVTVSAEACLLPGFPPKKSCKVSLAKPTNEGSNSVNSHCLFFKFVIVLRLLAA